MLCNAIFLTYRENEALGAKQVGSAPLLPLELGEVLDNRLPLGPLLHEALAPLSRSLHDHDLLRCET